MEITTALEFPLIEIEIQRQLGLLKRPEHAYDGRRLLRNLTKMVSELSKRELTMRRTAGHPRRAVDEQVALINSEINSLEQWITLLLMY